MSHCLVIPKIFYESDLFQLFSKPIQYIKAVKDTINIPINRFFYDVEHFRTHFRTFLDCLETQTVSNQDFFHRRKRNNDLVIRSLGDFKPLFDYLRIHYSTPIVLYENFLKKIFVWCLRPALPFTSSFPYKFHCHHKNRLKLSRKLKNSKKSKNIRKWIKAIKENSENFQQKSLFCCEN